jgi:hypothetical protein
MQFNQSERAKNIKKILTALNSIQKLPMALIKYGSLLSAALFTIGAVLVILNNTVLPYNSFFDMVSKEIVKTSFVLGAEAIIGGLVMDFVSKR